MIIVLLILPAYSAQTTGNTWRQLSKESRDAYIWGVADNWHAINTVAEKTSEITKVQFPGTVALHFIELSKCLNKGMTYGQVSVIVHQYVEANPSLWHYPMTSLVWEAVYKACESMK
jgi:hypothetical protein